MTVCHRMQGLRRWRWRPAVPPLLFCYFPLLFCCFGGDEVDEKKQAKQWGEMISLVRERRNRRNSECIATAPRLPNRSRARFAANPLHMQQKGARPHRDE